MSSHYELILPDLGIDGPIRVCLWLCEPGSRVTEEQPVVEILAKGVVIDLPAFFDGTLVEIFVEEDEPVEVGQPLAMFSRE